MLKVLVVEDDAELNHTVCSFLNQNGYRKRRGSYLLVICYVCL